jgi:hypothetical protein
MARNTGIETGVVKVDVNNDGGGWFKEPQVPWQKKKNKSKKPAQHSAFFSEFQLWRLNFLQIEGYTEKTSPLTNKEPAAASYTLTSLTTGTVSEEKKQSDNDIVDITPSSDKHSSSWLEKITSLLSTIIGQDKEPTITLTSLTTPQTASTATSSSSSTASTAGRSKEPGFFAAGRSKNSSYKKRNHEFISKIIPFPEKVVSSTNNFNNKKIKIFCQLD